MLVRHNLEKNGLPSIVALGYNRETMQFKVVNTSVALQNGNTNISLLKSNPNPLPVREISVVDFQLYMKQDKVDNFTKDYHCAIEHGEFYAFGENQLVPTREHVIRTIAHIARKKDNIYGMHIIIGNEAQYIEVTAEQIITEYVNGLLYPLNFKVTNKGIEINKNVNDYTIPKELINEYRQLKKS